MCYFYYASQYRNHQRDLQENRNYSFKICNIHTTKI